MQDIQIQSHLFSIPAVMFVKQILKEVTTYEDHKFTRKEKVALCVIALIDLMSFCSISLLSLFFPKETAIKGENIHLYGFAISFSAFVNVVASPIFGLACPKIGTKNMFVGAVIISRLSTIMFGFLQYVHNVTVFTVLSFLLRALETLGYSAYFVAGYAIVLKMFPENIGVIRGLLETVVGIGTTIGPALGELLFTYGGFGSPFYFVGTVVILLAFVGMFALEQKYEKDNDNSTLGEFLSLPMVLFTCGVVIVVGITTTFMDPILEQHLIHIQSTRDVFSKISLGSGSSEIAYIFLLIATAYGVTSPIWGYMSDKCKYYIWLMPLGLFLNGIAILLLEPAPFYNVFEDSMSLKLTTLGCLGVSMSMALVPTFRSLTAGAMSEGFKNSLKTHSFVGSIWSSMFSLGEIIGPGLGSLLFEKYNFAVVSCLVATINIFVALTFAFFLYSKKRKRNICCTFSFTIYF